MKYKEIIKATAVVYITWQVCVGVDRAIGRLLKPRLKKIENAVTK